MKDNNKERKRKKNERKKREKNVHVFNEFIIKKAKLIDDYIYIKKYLKYFLY